VILFEEFERSGKGLNSGERQGVLQATHTTKTQWKRKERKIAKAIAIRKVLMKT
jgi:hypothetical protein